MAYARPDTGGHKLSVSVHQEGPAPLDPPAPHETLVILARHGETEWNSEQRFQGQLQAVPLSVRGAEQAEALGTWLRSWLPSRRVNIFTSDLARALHTAQRIGGHLGVEPIASPALREMSLGEWQGLTIQEVERFWPGMLARRMEDFASFRPPGGESGSELLARAWNFYTGLLPGLRGKILVIVSHGGTLSMLVTQAMSWQLSDTWKSGKVRHSNTGVSVLRFDHSTGKHRLALLNSLGHLPVSEGALEQGQAS